MPEESGEIFSQFVVDKLFHKEEGTACFAPYLNIKVSSLLGKHDNDDSVIKARIDTGADITCIPEKVVKHLMPLLKGKAVTVRGHEGNVKRHSTYLVSLGLIGYPDEDQLHWVMPERGVLLTDSDIALIGVDITYKFDLIMKGREQTFSLIRR